MAGQITAYVGLTDRDWFNFLSRRAELDEVNFWQPRASTAFAALKLGEPFLFKLHSPNNYIVGGGVFVYWTRLPLSLAWDAFGEKNGAPTATEMTRRIEQYRRGAGSTVQDYEVGCILLEQPFFFERSEWMTVPGWQPSIQRGKTRRQLVEMLTAEG